MLTIFIIMAHAQPNYANTNASILQESELTDNTDHLKVDDVFNVKSPMSRMSNSEIEQLSQEFNNTELIIQSEGKEIFQNTAPDLKSTQCEEANEILSERAQ